MKFFDIYVTSKKQTNKIRKKVLKSISGNTLSFWEILRKDHISVSFLERSNFIVYLQHIALHNKTDFDVIEYETVVTVVEGSNLKPLQASWIIKLYGKMTPLRGKKVISNGLEKPGFNDGIKMGTAWLPSVDLFDEVDPIVRGRKEILDYNLMAALSINKDCLAEGCTTVQREHGDDSEWEDPNDDGCAFDLFNDDDDDDDDDDGDDYDDYDDDEWLLMK